MCPHHSLFLAQLSHLPPHFLLSKGSSFLSRLPTGSFIPLFPETAQLQPLPSSLALPAVLQPLCSLPGWLRPPSAYSAGLRLTATWL